MADLTSQRFRALTKEKIKNIAKNNPAELVGLIEQMRDLVAEQASKIYSKNLTPFAYSKLLAETPEALIGPIYGGKKYDTANKELAILLLNTYKSKSMTVKGAEKIARQQDIAIFGKEHRLTKTGLHYEKIRYRMSPSERDIFWRVYNEIQNQSTVKQSDVVLQEMTNVVYERVSSMDIDGAYSTLIATMADSRGLDQSFINEVTARIRKESEFRYS